MTTAVASAPAPAAPAAAPAAPAAATPAPAASSAPAWSSGQNVSDWMKGVTSNAPAAPAAPATPAPAAPAATAAPAASVEAPPQPAAAAEAPKPGEVPTDPAAAPAPVTPKLLAGRFKTPEELENAYAESSREGRRLATLTKQRDEALAKAVAETQRITSELESVKLLQELGPDVAEPTDEEMNAWPAAKVAKHFDAKNKRAALKQQLEAKKAATVQAVKEATEKRQGEVLGLFNRMAADGKSFPQFQDLAPVMDELMDLEPGVVGHSKTPLILYLAARGHMALQLEQEAARRSGASTEAARTTAAASLPGVSAPGGAAAAPAPGTVPAGGVPDPDSDQAHNARILAAARKMSSTVFPGIS